MTDVNLPSQAKIPGLCVLIQRICRIPAECSTWECKIGFLCLVSNIPIGMIGVTTCLLLNSTTGKTVFLLLGTVIYAISWLILLLGIFLTGKHLAAKIRKNIRIKVNAWKKFRKKLRQNYASQH